MSPPMKLGAVFFIAIGFGVLCILGGICVAAFGPMFLPHDKPASRPAPAVVAAAPAANSIDARLADIQARLGSAPLAGGPEQAAPQLSAALTERLDRLEASQQRLAAAASGALAAATLTQAAQTSRPFAGELGALEATLPDSLDVRALRPLAEAGAPTSAALAAQYPDIAARAAVAARARASGDGFFARVAQALAAIVTIRRVDKLDGAGTDAILARAGRHIEDGDLAGADTELATLPATARAAVDPWRKAARRRLEIEQRIQAIRSSALADLARSGVQLRPAPAAPVQPAPSLQGPPA
jgi:hypothetical protein